jgi:superfamily I DNA and/or RNA helicase
MIMALLHVDSLPPRITKGELLSLLCSASGIRGAQVGKIDLRGTMATVEVPAGWVARLAKALDGVALKDRRLRVWSSDGMGSPSAEDHFRRLSRLVELESDAEAVQAREALALLSPADAERTGESLISLVIVEEDSGLGGRCILTLAKRNRTLPLPWNRLGPGTPVLLSPESGATTEGLRGVVCERRKEALRLATNAPPAEADRDATYRLDLSGDETARQRQLAALERSRTAGRSRLAELRDVLLGDASPTFEVAEPFTPLDAALNPSQQEAVAFALSARDVAVLHGPPGTGKTTAVVELIRQAVRRGQKVLACAPSNLAVDNLLERLLTGGERAVRLGHPARVLPALREHTLDLIVEDHPDTRQARKWAKEAYALFRQAGKFTRARPEPGARQAMRQEARALLADARRMEDQAVERILNEATVLCATLTGLDGEVLGQRTFDLAVIDEASQSTEPASWLPLLRCQRVVLAGDHCQLPPTVLSQEAAQQGLGVSLMERLVARYGSQVTRRLDVQYRMHEAIMAFSSRQFYDGELQAHPSVRGHLLCDLPGLAAGPLTSTPVQFIDTAGAGYDEQEEPGGESRRNPQEADLVCRKVRALLEAGVPAEAIAVIAPYSAQVRLLREKLDIPGLEIDSVDGFQGREKEAVVLSLVRSNPEGEVGFLADVRRMNVALTRARRKVLIVGDSATLGGHPFYQDLLSYFESIGAYHSVWEEEDQTT